MRRLMGHLAQFSSFFNQGEVLCTQSLTYLLQDAEARKVFSEHVASCVGTRVQDDLIWKAEACQPDG